MVYWPGSHRLPYHQFAPGEYRHQHGYHTDEDDAAMTRFEIESCRQAGLEEKTFLPRRGQVLIWHASLLHGGRAVEDPDSTRKSLVVHFATRRRNRICRRSVVDRSGADPVVYRTEETVEQDGRDGFASPIARGA